MTIKKLIPGILIALLAVLSAQAQGTFQNLDFESANLFPISAGQYGGQVPITAALPGWNASIGGVPVTQVLQNNYTLGQASIDIFSPNWSFANPGIIDGDYTVFLQSGGNPQHNPIGVNVSLSQSGTIPAYAQSLEFKAWNWPSVNAAFSVSFAGNTLSPVVLSSGQSPSGQLYNVFGVNLEPYAGDTGQLEFTSILTGAPSWTEFDDISFSPTAVPEPGIVALTVIGGLLFGARKWFARQITGRHGD